MTLWQNVTSFVFVLHTRKYLVNCDKWRFAFINGYTCLPDRWVMKVSSLAFPCKHLLSVSMFMYKCHLMLISVNTVDSTFSFILRGARVQGNFTNCRATLEVSHNFRYGNTSVAICWMSIGTCQVRNLVYRVTLSPVRLSLCNLF